MVTKILSRYKLVLGKNGSKENMRSPVFFGIAAWMAINVLLMAVLILSGDLEDLNNWIEIVLWIISIPALLSTKKWGVAFALFVLIYTLSTSMGILVYYQIWLNVVRVAVNTAITVYLFRLILKNQTE